MYRDISNVVVTEKSGGLVQHIQLPGNITNERFSWVPGQDDGQRGHSPDNTTIDRKEQNRQHHFGSDRSALSVPSRHATRRKHEGWDTVRLPKPRQGKSSGEVPKLTNQPANQKPSILVQCATECAAPGRLMFQSLRYLNYRDTCIFVMYYS
ncbi:hypothetical protein T265_02656 [Opisthorchis viverrini]|uniref:Uncharacterized protein n=1 Tax=Opisthorchis viverrini TaxID=6198 RepID=A0A074ZUZ1_OPIVI|nr:hypothetical protein T265_02656 [Opisthorchis viverrini]KER30971.1 hypothetical protein T265_02656 [Opisthorchis viverrini]